MNVVTLVNQMKSVQWNPVRMCLNRSLYIFSEYNKTKSSLTMYIQQSSITNGFIKELFCKMCYRLYFFLWNLNHHTAACRVSFTYSITHTALLQSCRDRTFPTLSDSHMLSWQRINTRIYKSCTFSFLKLVFFCFKY